MQNMKTMVFAALLAVGVSTAAPAQDAVSVEEMRTMLINNFEMARMMDVEFAEAIPDSALRWAPTEGVRGFTDQVAHAGMGNTLFAATAMQADRPPRDTAAYLNDKTALVEALNEAYDWVIEGLKAMPADEFLAERNLFGSAMPVWRVYTRALDHGTWTRGQLVPYFRLNGVKPPGYKAF